MSSQPRSGQPTVTDVAQYREELQKVLALLRDLGETSGMEQWSPEVRKDYHSALDDLTALEAHILIFQLSLGTDEEGASA